MGSRAGRIPATESRISLPLMAIAELVFQSSLDVKKGTGIVKEHSPFCGVESASCHLHQRISDITRGGRYVLQF